MAWRSILSKESGLEKENRGKGYLFNAMKAAREIRSDNAGDQERTPYVVVLDHEGGKGYLLRRNKIAVFNKEGDVIVSRSTRSLGNSVQDGCDAIVNDWAAHNTVATPLAPGSATFQSTPAKTEPEQRSAFVAPTAKNDLVVPAQVMPTPAAPPRFTSLAR